MSAMRSKHNPFSCEFNFEVVTCFHAQINQDIWRESYLVVGINFNQHDSTEFSGC